MAPGIAEKKNNSLPLWGNEKTMNLNSLILTNILSSHYFKVNLYKLKTYHEVIDEIYYQVNHLEPWEKGSRKTSGQTGMCGGVRGVGAGGIVSTAFCILYKLFTLKLTRKQVVGLINHSDSPYIRALGFMYIRYTQPPADLWDWYENYLSDPEELDVRAGGGQSMCMGEMLRQFLSKLEWFSTLFPRIPVPIQKDLERKLTSWRARPENKALVEAADWKENAEKPAAVEEEYVEEPSKHRRHDAQARDSNRTHIRSDPVEESSKDQHKHRRHRDRSPISRHRSPEHQKHRHRSRSPVRRGDLESTRDERGSRGDRKHHNRHHEKLSDRSHHRRGHSKERSHDRERNPDKRHEHSHKRDSSRHSEKERHSHNHHH